MNHPHSDSNALFDMPAAIFEKERYVRIHNLVPRQVCEKIAEHAKRLQNGSRDSQCPLSMSFYGDSVMETLMQELLPRMEQITGKRLYPTYAYFRIYKNGDELKHHTDRPACEISVTLTLDIGTGKIWPIYIENPHTKNVTEAMLDVGDALVYHGCECDHWREKYVEGDGQVQVFMHYVQQDGKNAEWKFDKRSALNIK